MEDNCNGVENSSYYYYQKRLAESDNGLVFIVGPGGRAAVVSMQIPDEPQAPAPQEISGPQEASSAIIVPLSPATLINDASAAVAEASGTRTDTMSQSPLTVSSFYAPTTTLDSSTAEDSVPLGTSTVFASISTDGAIAPSGAATESSLKTSFPTTISSEAISLKPPIYVGIAVGTIAGIACLTALIAWWIRIRSHVKRRRLYGDTDVPWALSESADSGLEEARNMTQTRSNLESVGLGGPEDLAHAGAWEPRGDRDVGEPRRSESYPNSSANSSGHFAPFVHDPYPCRAAPAILGQHDTFLPSIQPFQNARYPNARPLPSYLRSVDSSHSGSVDDHTAGSSLGPLRVANLLPGDQSVATSRAATALGMNSHAYIEDLDDLMREADRSRPDQGRRGSEGWTGPLKSIFRVMASVGKQQDDDDDGLTEMPHRRSARNGDGTERSRSTNLQDPGTTSRDAALSRASSAYSASSAAVTLSRTPSTSPLSFSRQGTPKSGDFFSIARPPAVARVSSTGCSVASSQLSNNEEAARRALIDRRRRARRQDEWSEREASGS
ncbi:hypothetical protein AX15_004766 [Amanita polypyramis BW_CC]|nr:hypothetical protein AX15_004766 [Amanita polypyramis BW_CC]